jgi:uncharacterized membrane protein YdjX (TVP38/TMEM64 family)
MDKNTRSERVKSQTSHRTRTELRSERIQNPMSKTKSITWTVAILAIGILLVVLYFQMDKHDQISNHIRAWGGFGIFVAILLMALFCVIPVPSEFLMVMNMKIYGVWWGIFYTWIGAMLGAVAVFFIARYIGRGLLSAFISDERFHQVDVWVKKWGVFGLLLARLVPLPFIVVNYTAGVMKSVTIWNYLWTTAIGLLPYDIGSALVFLGASQRMVHWLVLGAVAVIAVWIAGYKLNKYVNRAERWAH